MNPSGILLALGIILCIVAVLKFLGIVAIGGAAAGTLLVVGIILVVVAHFVVGPRYRGRVR